MSTKRLVCVWPSARANAARSSFSVSGPNVVNVNEPADLEHAAELGERARQVVHPLQREVAPDEIERDAARTAAR